MADGDLLVGPDDVEFAGRLIAAAKPAGADVFVTGESVYSGWHPTHSAENLPTQAGMSLGKRLVDEMYPSIVGVHFADLDVLELWLAAEGTVGTLSWWSRGRDMCLQVSARLAQVLPSDDVEHARRAETVADLLWEVPRPLTIVEIGGSS